MKRAIYRVRWLKFAGGEWSKGAWFITRNKSLLGGANTAQLFYSKLIAIKHARQAALTDQPSQLVVHDKKGQIVTEYTYQRDPRRHKG